MKRFAQLDRNVGAGRVSAFLWGQSQQWLFFYTTSLHFSWMMDVVYLCLAPHTASYIIDAMTLSKPFFAKLNVVRNNLVCWNHSSLEWNGIRQMRQIFFSFKLKCGMGSQNCFGPSFHKSDANWYLIKKSTKIASTIIALKFQVVTEQLKYFFLHFLLTAYYFYFSQTKTIFINFRCYCQELKRTTEIIRNQEQLTHSDMNNF